ncbi:oxygenase MpaB family protein [Gordonia sp. GONU]|uniref:oxygenase MpaB family protein n=1 Tax=Gordonia sp. GONU TaxID=2972949 RepID=UPI0035C852D4
MPWRYVRHLPRIRLLTWGMAGERLRSIYGVEWSADHEHRFRRTVRMVRLWQGLCPGPIRRRHGRRQRIRRATRLRRTAVTDPHTNGRNDR